MNFAGREGVLCLDCLQERLGELALGDVMLARRYDAAACLAERWRL